MTASVFLSYRRRDSEDATARLYERLVRRLGAGRVFRDTADILAGQRFPARIRDALAGCSVVLAIIGPDWLVVDLNDAQDWVRQELQAALKSKALVIPVLVGRTDFPEAAKLPRALRPLVKQLNAATIHGGSHFERDADALAERVASHLGIEANAPQAGSVTVSRPKGPALSRWLREGTVRTAIERNKRSFVGRVHVFAELEATLESEGFPSGYVVVQGAPGIGKTAIAAQLVERWAEQRCVAHFNVRDSCSSPSAFLANLCAQLVITFGLPYEDLPDDALRSNEWLLRLLRESVAHAPGGSLRVVVDALDEARDPLARAGNPLLLPRSLPDGVHVVVTTQPGGSNDFLDRRDISLLADDPRHLADVQLYISRVLLESKALAARLLEWRLSHRDFIDLLQQKSEGNFMYLQHVLPALSNPKMEINDLDSVRRLPRGLTDYYSLHWSRMTVSDPNTFALQDEPVVSALAAVREPVSLDMLANIAQLSRHLVQSVLDRWQSFIAEDLTSTMPKYRIYHNSFADFLGERVDMTRVHSKIADAYLRALPPGIVPVER